METYFAVISDELDALSRVDRRPTEEALFDPHVALLDLRPGASTTVRIAQVSVVKTIRRSFPANVVTQKGRFRHQVSTADFLNHSFFLSFNSS